eukprot:5271241-Amphidinium_carterae.1
MTKFSPTLRDAQDACNAYFLQHGIVTYPVRGLNGMFAICRHDGKVVKPTTFQPPRLAPLLDACCSVDMCTQGG